MKNRKKDILENSINKELSKSNPDFSVVKKLLLKLFIHENPDISINRDKLNLEDKNQIERWLNKKHPDLSRFIILKPVYKFIFGGDLFHKIDSYSQYHCPLCNGNSIAIYFIIHIPPQSFQSNNKKLKMAFTDCIQDQMQKKKIDSLKNKRLCVLITFILNKDRPEKDIDNMAKMLLDACNGVLYKDDKQIDHLNLFKFRTNKSEEYIAFNIRESQININNDVLFEEFFIDWG